MQNIWQRRWKIMKRQEDDALMGDLKVIGGSSSSGLTDEQLRAVVTYPDEQRRAPLAE